MADSESSSEEREYVVEKIVGKRKLKGKTQYHIKWQGFPVSDNTWENEENLNCPEILKEFEEQSKKEKPEKKKQTKRKLDDDLVIKGSVEESSSAAVKSPRGASPRNQEIDRILQSKSSASPAPHLPPPAKRGFLFGDEPAGILGAMAPTSKTEAAYQVQWKDKNGKKSRDCTWVQSSQLRKYAPLFLIEYLEKNMKQKNPTK